MDYRDAIRQFPAEGIQEEADQRLILEYIDTFPDTVLLRDNPFAHITSSGFIVNEALTKTLMVHHHIYCTWSWTGGHADGDSDLLAVALREAREETGVRKIWPLSPKIVSVDILPVWGHVKHGRYVSAHQHLSISYLLVASESSETAVCPEENSGVMWIPLEELAGYCNEPEMLPVYQKLINRARTMREQHKGDPI